MCSQNGRRNRGPEGWVWIFLWVFHLSSSCTNTVPFLKIICCIYAKVPFLTAFDLIRTINQYVIPSILCDILYILWFSFTYIKDRWPPSSLHPYSTQSILPWLVVRNVWCLLMFMTMCDSGVICLLSCWIMFKQVILMNFDVQC